MQTQYPFSLSLIKQQQKFLKVILWFIVKLVYLHIGKSFVFAYQRQHSWKFSKRQGYKLVSHSPSSSYITGLFWGTILDKEALCLVLG